MVVLCDIFHVLQCLTHWGRVTHICVGKLSIIGSDNGLSPGRRQDLIRTNAGILLIWPLGSNFSEIWIGIQTFSLNKIHTKMSFGKCRPFVPGLNVLRLTTLCIRHATVVAYKYTSEQRAVAFEVITVITLWTFHHICMIPSIGSFYVSVVIEDTYRYLKTSRILGRCFSVKIPPTKTSNMVIIRCELCAIL